MTAPLAIGPTGTCPSAGQGGVARFFTDAAVLGTFCGAGGDFQMVACDTTVGGGIAVFVSFVAQRDVSVANGAQCTARGWNAGGTVGAPVAVGVASNGGGIAEGITFFAGKSAAVTKGGTVGALL